MESNHKKNAKLFKALSDETRLNILELLKEGEKCACRLLEELNIVQSTLSHHMKILCDSGIVAARKEGKWSYYSIDNEGAENINILLEFYTGTLKVNNVNPCLCKPSK